MLAGVKFDRHRDRRHMYVLLYAPFGWQTGAGDPVPAFVDFFRSKKGGMGCGLPFVMTAIVSRSSS